MIVANHQTLGRICPTAGRRLTDGAEKGGTYDGHAYTDRHTH
jgi:hypothetical protein